MGERTFVMLKPEAVTRGIVGEILTRIERRGLRITAMKLVKATLEQVERLYEVHRGKPFFEGLVQHVSSGPVVVMVVEGSGAVQLLRKMTGATDPAEAEVGTIRRDYGLTINENIIHAADSLENAEREISIFFKPSEILLSDTP